MKRASVVLALVLAGCASAPSEAEREAEAARIRAFASSTSGPQFEIASHEGQKSVDAATMASHLGKVDPEFSAAIAFAIGSNGDDGAAELIERHLPAEASPAEVAAAAMGLGYSKSDATERVLLDLALRPSQPPEAVEALFSYYRMRGGDKQPPATLPDDRLLAYAKHADARGRAALGHLGRAIKDPALIDVLGSLAVADADFEVRRAAYLGLAEGPAKKERPAEARATCLDHIRHGLKDADPRVVAAACRALSSYDDPSVAEGLVFAATHQDFNVRVAAIEGMGRRKIKDHGVPALLELLARSDASTSVRYTAGVQLVAIDPAAAQPLVQHLLLGRAPATTSGVPLEWKEQIESEYVRCAGVEILAKSDDLTAPVRIASIAKSDPHVRVRETAVGAFEGKRESQIAKDAIRAALADADPVVVATACGVVAKNGVPEKSEGAPSPAPGATNDWKAMAADLEAIPARFPGCLGADAREGAISALSELDGAAHRAWFDGFVNDPNPGVRAAAAKAIAAADKKDPPKDFVRGADLTGELLPGGAPIFGKDVFLVVETNKGTMKIRLFPDQAPVHCAHVASLAMKGFYDGLTWHRVVPDFVIQGACPRGDGEGNAGVTLPLEPTRIPFERGTLGMPRSEHPDTGGCQLFICHSRAPHLDVRYTAFGKVVEGLDVIDKIDVDDRIVRVRVEGAR
jgi:peptidyl-prolyl cis-trans isomerase B (cyclophilin B)